MRLSNLLSLLLVSTASCLGMDQRSITFQAIPSYTDSRDAILAQYNNRTIGRVLYKDNTIFWIRVDQRYQRLGIGSELFIQCLRQIAQRHTKAEWFAENSIPFYQKQGAKIVDPSYVVGVSQSALMEFDFERDGDPEKNMERR